MTFIRNLLSNAEIEIEPEEIKIDERPLSERHSETINVLLSRLHTQRANIEEEIANARERLRQVCICIRAYETAANAFREASEQVPADPVQRALKEIQEASEGARLHTGDQG